jgi:chorismate-pyruvate lyase
VNRPSHLTTDAELYSGSVARLASLFHDDLAELGRFEPVSADEMPDPYRRLLAHNDHMTVTLEASAGSSVDVRVLAEWRDETSYARNSLLARHTDGAVLQFGIMRIWLADMPATARDEITVKRQPLGRVLINHNLLREVELITLWRIMPGPALQRHLALAPGQLIYGRSAQILVDERPTVQMLEIVAPAK